MRSNKEPTIATAGDLQALSGLPILGSIPRVRYNSRQKLAMASQLDMGSPLAEAYRVAAANLRFILPNGFPRITVITSANPNEGKSTSAVNLALSQSQQGLKVLLIDADLRRPSVHELLSMGNHKGLSNFLGGEVEISAVTHAVRDVKGLYVVTAGTLVANPVGLISSPSLAQVLNLATQHFDSVIIDAPPALGFADAMYLASLAQATVIVADEENLNRKRLMNAVEQLRRAKNNVVGFLVVKAQEEVDYSYYSSYQTRMAVQSAMHQWDNKLPKSKKRGLNLSAS
jgi:capsular exopolysaccharide synthesis family protein